MAYDAEHFTVTEVSTPPHLPNRADCLLVRDRIAALPSYLFDMATTFPDCGTAGCIMGWTAEVFNLEARTAIGEFRGDVAACLWGFTDSTNPLFFPTLADKGVMSDGRSGFKATPAQAVRVLDHYLATGEVDWSVA